MPRCSNPIIMYQGEWKAFGCGQCLPCRISRRRIWTHRIFLEAMEHTVSTFITLTYDDDHLPKTDEGLPTLRPRDLQLFIKRYRKVMPKFRFFAVGEYGDKTFRPHYHIAIFGGDPCSSGICTRGLSGSCCRAGNILAAAWGLGLCHIGLLTVQSAQYIAGYVTKKMTSADDERLQGRHPEFSRMSNRPGIGAFFCDDVASDLLDKSPDAEIGYTLRHGSKEWPLGRYLRDRIKVRIGQSAGANEATIQEARQEMSELLEAAQNDRIYGEKIHDAVKRKMNEKYQGHYDKLQWRSENFKKRGRI
jgi:hypothetical protein